jgi:hypothetical protein
MTDQSPQKWAETFAADLVLDGERVPFDRIVQRHHQALVAQRARGLTWQGLANLLRRAGAVRENGKAYSADHLRVAFARIESGSPRQAITRSSDPVTRRSSRGRMPSAGWRDIAPAARASTPPNHSLPEASTRPGDKDVSDDELGLALDRINKLKQ